MEKLKKELCFAITSFIDVQQKHIAFLTAGELKTLSGWHEKRQCVLQRLKQCLGQISSSHISKDKELAGMVRKALENMQNGEKQLAILVRRQQEIIGQKMGTIRQGKTVLRGYGLSRSAGSLPTYLSSKT